MQKKEEKLVINATQNQDQDCEVCYKIKCKNCGWEPDDKELTQVLAGKLTNCPSCNKAK